VAPYKKEVSPDDWADFNRRQLSSFIITAFQFHDRGLFNPFGLTRPLSSCIDLRKPSIKAENLHQQLQR
jgi:hypothetical protein